MGPDTLQKIWELRYAGKVSEAFALLQGFEPGNERERAELYLLNCSFARHASKLEDAFAWIDKAKAELAGRPIFQLSMQTAICLDVQSKFAESLQHYQEALKLAASEFERVFARVNLAICRYNLSLPFGELLREIGDLENHPLAGTLEQLRVIELKNFFHEGNFEKALALHFPKANQGLYLQAWMESLPWFSGEKKKLARFRELASSEKDYFQKSYLLQTLQADPRLSTADDSAIPVQERADRIYLWTWRWLENPASVNSTLLAQELARFPFDSAHLTMTDEVFLLLRSAGSWLSLFNAPFASGFRAWSDKYFPTLPAKTHFDRELQLISAVKNADHASLEKLLPGEPELRAMLVKITRELHGRATKPAASSLLVRLSDASVQAGSERILSESLAKLLALLVKEGSLSFESCALECFGLRQFDSLDHGPKIHNLLQRAKKLLPTGCELSTKSQRIYLEGAAGRILVEEGSALESSFPAFTWPELDKKQSVGLEKKQEVDYKARLVLAFSDKQSLSRAEIQKELGLSKATTSRLLLAWAKEGLLESKGAGASRVYSLASK
jgi:hypothetical protein